MKHRRINRTFNTWNKSYKPSEAIPSETIYSDQRDRGTAKAEALLESLARQPKDPKTGQRPMLVPPPLPGRR